MKFISNSDYGKPVETGTIFYTTLNGWWDPELECEILKTSRRYKKVQKKRAKERIILPPDFEIRVAKNKNLQIAYEVISGSWGNGADRKNRLSAAGYNYEEIQTIVNEICVPKKEKCMRKNTFAI